MNETCRDWQHVYKTHVRDLIVVFAVAYSVVVSTAGNIGAELSYNNVGMFISSDAGNSWRPVRHTPTTDRLVEQTLTAAVKHLTATLQILYQYVLSRSKSSALLSPATFSFHSRKAHEKLTRGLMRQV